MLTVYNSYKSRGGFPAHECERRLAGKRVLCSRPYVDERTERDCDRSFDHQHRRGIVTLAGICIGYRSDNSLNPLCFERPGKKGHEYKVIFEMSKFKSLVRRF